MLLVKPIAHDSTIAFTRLLHKLGIWNKLSYETIDNWRKAITGAY
jgi:hypothetical protein